MVKGELKAIELHFRQIAGIKNYINLKERQEKMLIRISQVAYLLGVSATSLRRWDAEGILIPTFRTPGGHRRYKLTEVLALRDSEENLGSEAEVESHVNSTAVTYARVSSPRQKEDLERQEKHLQSVVEEKEWILQRSYKDIGSGLNDQRKGLLRLIRDLPIIQPSVVVCSYGDRLARFGTNILRVVCELFGTTILVTHDQEHPPTSDQQLVSDVLAVLTSFAGKLHRSRRGRQTQVMTQAGH